MLKDWNTMENASLVEKKLLKRVDELSITYFTKDTVFDRKPNEIIKAKYKQTYYPRRKKNKFVIEEL